MEYNQPELNEKDKKTWKQIGNHVINRCSRDDFSVIKTKDVKRLQQQIEWSDHQRPYGKLRLTFSV